MIASTLLAGCTSIQVEPIAEPLSPDAICIVENPKVIVGDFLSVVRNRIEDHGIRTAVYAAEPPPRECEYVLNYVALKRWDLATYLYHAELRLMREGRRVGYAEYHLRGGGGLYPLKWRGTKEKMRPVVDRLLRR
jgi:hypothetical protein